jgi:hypothetical protein
VSDAVVTFAARAARLAGAAGVAFGWRPDDFWRATPDELAALVRAAGGDEAVRPPDAALIARLLQENPDG